MKLIGAVLAHVETEQDNGGVTVPELPGYSPREIDHHVELCVEAGYLHASGSRATPGRVRYSTLLRLTWTGHNALDELRGEGLVD